MKILKQNLSDKPTKTYVHRKPVPAGFVTVQVLVFCLQVGMSIDSQLFVNKFPIIAGALVLLIAGKTLLVTAVGRFYGLSTVAAARAGLLLAPGGEFAFVAFGEAVNQASFDRTLVSSFSTKTMFTLAFNII